MLHLIFILQKQPPEVFCKKGVLRNFAKFKGKHLCQSLFFNKVVGLRPATLLKKRLWHRHFPVNFMKFPRTPFLQNTSRQLLLILQKMTLKVLPLNNSDPSIRISKVYGSSVCKSIDVIYKLQFKNAVFPNNGKKQMLPPFTRKLFNSCIN